MRAKVPSPLMEEGQDVGDLVSKVVYLLAADILPHPLRKPRRRDMCRHTPQHSNRLAQRAEERLAQRTVAQVRTYPLLQCGINLPVEIVGGICASLLAGLRQSAATKETEYAGLQGHHHFIDQNSTTSQLQVYQQTNMAQDVQLLLI